MRTQIAKPLLKSLCVSAVLLLFSKELSSQVITTPVTPNQAVSNVLIGGGVNASNVVYTGSANALAQFTATGTNLPIQSGLIISTGNASNPLLNGAPSNFCSTSNGTPGNPILSAISGVPTNDAAILQFDFIPLGDTLKFNYVFGSEEYNDFVGGSVNDVFAFLLSGPNPAGGNYVDYNIALLPGTTTPVSINTVNNGYSFGCTGPCNQAVYPGCPYFIDNSCGAPSGIACDAFTVQLTAVAPVVRCQTYTIKLGIADGGDSVYDSWVFLEENSFVSPQLLFESSPLLGGGLVGNVDTLLYEGCTNALVTVTRNFDIDSLRTYNLSVSGTAVDGVDYTGVPLTVTFNPGDSSATFNIQALLNQASNSNSTLTIAITDSFVCGSVNSFITNTINFVIQNVDPLSVDIGPDLATCNTINILPTVSGGVAPYTYDWNNGASTSPAIVNYALPNDMTFVLGVTDLCGVTVYDTLFADLKDNPYAGLDIFPIGLTTANESCGEVLFGVSRNQLTNLAKSYTIYVGSGTATEGADFTYDNVVNFAAGQTVDTLSFSAIYDMITEGNEYIYLVTIDSLCTGAVIKDSIRIDIRDVEPISVNAGSDISTGCPIVTQNLQATASAGIGDYTYLWSTGETTDNISVTPSVTSTYYVTVTDSCGRTATDTINVSVYYPPTADFNFTSPNYCEPATIFYTDNSTTNHGTINSWNYFDENGAPLSSIDDWAHTISTAGSYNITLVVGTDNPNCYDTISKVVVVQPKPHADFWWSPNPITEVNPTGSFYNNSSPDVSLWQYEVDGAGYNTPDFTHTFALPGEYTCYLYVSNEHGCRDTVEKVVVVEGEHTFYIPNTFTPDRDGLNELWGPSGENINYVEYFIFDRWGEKIFEANSEMDSYLWDGKHRNGKELKSDTYVYRMFVVDKYGKEYQYFGFVNLLNGN